MREIYQAAGILLPKNFREVEYPDDPDDESDAENEGEDGESEQDSEASDVEVEPEHVDEPGDAASTLGKASDPGFSSPLPTVRKDIDELESTEKVYQHRIVPVPSGFGCQDCQKVAADLMGLVSQPCAKHPGTVAPTSYKPVPTEVDPAKVAKCSTAEVGHEGSMGDTSPEQKQLEEELANLQAQEALLNEMAALKLLEEEQSELQKSSKLEDMRSLLNSSVPAASHSAPFPAGTTLDQVDTLPYMIDEFGVPHEIPVDAVGLSEEISDSESEESDLDICRGKPFAAKEKTEENKKDAEDEAVQVRRKLFFPEA